MPRIFENQYDGPLEISGKLPDFNQGFHPRAVEGHRTPSERRMDRRVAIYEAQAHAEVMARYHAEKREGEAFSTWAWREINEAQTSRMQQLFSSDYSANKSSNFPNIIIRRSS